jgi:hypothetical protein
MPRAAAPHSATPLYFLHIPKTGGTSVAHFFKSLFPHHEICPAWLWDHLDGWPMERLQNYRLFVGHFGDALENYLGVKMRTVTVLREPVERSISQYAHVRRDELHPYHKLAEQLSLREFCVHPETRHMIENYQAKYLASRIPDVIRTANRTQAARVRDFGITDAFEHIMDCSLSPKDLQRRARARLDDCAAVGVTERLDETLGLFARTAGVDWQSDAPKKNTADNRPAVDPETIALIRELTAIDVALHGMAGRLLHDGDIQCAS